MHKPVICSQYTCWDDSSTCFNDSPVRNNRFRTIWKEHTHLITLFYTEFGQGVGQAVGKYLKLCIGDLATHKKDGCFVLICLGGLIKGTG